MALVVGLKTHAPSEPEKRNGMRFGFVVSHPCRDKAASWMGHPEFVLMRTSGPKGLRFLRPDVVGLKLFSCMTSFTYCLQTSFTLFPFDLSEGVLRWRGGRWMFLSSGFGLWWLQTGVVRA